MLMCMQRSSEGRQTSYGYFCQFVKRKHGEKHKLGAWMVVWKLPSPFFSPHISGCNLHAIFPFHFPRLNSWSVAAGISISELLVALPSLLWHRDSHLAALLLHYFIQRAPQHINAIWKKMSSLFSEDLYCRGKIKSLNFIRLLPLMKTFWK